MSFVADNGRHVPDILQRRSPTVAPRHVQPQYARSASVDVMRSPPPSYRSFLRQKSLREHQARRHDAGSRDNLRHQQQTASVIDATAAANQNVGIIYNKQTSVPLERTLSHSLDRSLEPSLSGHGSHRNQPVHSHSYSTGSSRQQQQQPHHAKRVNFAAEAAGVNSAQTDQRKQRNHFNSVMV